MSCLVIKFFLLFIYVNFIHNHKFEITLHLIFHMENPSNMKFTPQEQQEILRFQQIQKQLEMFTQQLTTMELQAKDMEQALIELEKAEDDATIFKAVGGLFIKKSKSDLLKSTKEAKESLELRIKSLKTNKARIESQFEEKRKKIEEILKSQGYSQ